MHLSLGYGSVFRKRKRNPVENYMITYYILFAYFLFVTIVLYIKRDLPNLNIELYEVSMVTIPMNSEALLTFKYDLTTEEFNRIRILVEEQIVGYANGRGKMYLGNYFYE